MTWTSPEASLCMTILNRADLLALTLRRYAAAFAESCARSELVIVDDQSTDAVEPVLRAASEAFGMVRWIRMDKRLSSIPIVANNPALGVNLAVKHARSHIVVKTDPECYPLTDVLGLAIERFRHDRMVFCRCIRGTARLNAALRSWAGPLPDEAGIDARDPLLWETKRFVCAQTKWAYWFTSVFSRVKFFGAGGVDERFLSGFAGEDDELAERMGRTGAKTSFDDDLSVVHLWHPPPQRVPGFKPEWHARNKSLLEDARSRRAMLANEGYDWGSDGAVTGIVEFGIGK